MAKPEYIVEEASPGYRIVSRTGHIIMADTNKINAETIAKMLNDAFSSGVYVGMMDSKRSQEVIDQFGELG